MSKPPTRVSLRWTGELAFVVRARNHTIVTDGNSETGLSPVELMAAALASCMGTDVAHILAKGRQGLEGLDVEIVADRADDNPHRFVARAAALRCQRRGELRAARAGNSALPREILLRLALDAAGHPARVHLVDQPQVSTPPRSSRLAYLDWLRGITVLVMIEAHTFDSWTLASERARPMFGRLMVLGGMAAPLFLFLAGVAAALAASAQIDRGRSAGEAARRVERRGWQTLPARLSLPAAVVRARRIQPGRRRC